MKIASLCFVSVVLIACGGSEISLGDAGSDVAVVDVGVDSATLLFSEDPATWFKAGNNPADYTLTQADTAVMHDGKPTVRLESITADMDGGVFDAPWAIARPSMDKPATAYIGKRVRMRADIKVENAPVGAWLWLRIDADQDKALKIANMIQPVDLRVKGTKDFTETSIVLDVPAGTVDFAYGFGLSGTGKAWIGNVTFEAVGPEVPETPH